MMAVNGFPHRSLVPPSFLRWIVHRGLLETATEDEMNALATLFLPGNGRQKEETADEFRGRLRSAGSELLKQRSN